MSIDAASDCRRKENTAVTKPADDTLLSQAIFPGNSGGDNPNCEVNPCYYATAKLPCHDNKVARPDAYTHQDACCSEPCQALFARHASAPAMKRPYDPPAVVGGCGMGDDLGGQTSGEHIKRRARSKQPMCVKGASRVASTHEEQTEPTGRRPLRQIQRTGKNCSVSTGPPSRRGPCIADCLSLADHWLAESKKERLQSWMNRPGQSISPPKAAHSLGDSVLYQPTTPLCDQDHPLELKTRGASVRLRGRAAAEWAAGAARRRDEKQMTGTPEITRLGRSKRRSVDDLFLFKRTADTARRQNQDDREAQEDNFITGRPVSKRFPSFLRNELYCSTRAMLGSWCMTIKRMAPPPFL